MDESKRETPPQRAKRWFNGVLIFLLGAMTTKLVDPWEWYHSIIDRPAIQINATQQPTIGAYRKNIFQKSNHYTVGQVQAEIQNVGKKADENVFVEINFPDDADIYSVGGAWGTEIHESDGQWIPIERQPDLPDHQHEVLMKILYLPPGLEDTITVLYSYETGKPPKNPTVFGYDSLGICYATWLEPTTNP